MGRSKETTKKQEKKSIRSLLFISLIVLIALVALVLSVMKRSEKPTTLAPKFTKQGEVTFYSQQGTPIITIDVEIADTDEKRELGLMGRPTLGERQGMLFLFDREHIASFWMKNTILPLDMIFINSYGTIVTIHENTTPFSEQTYTATAPTMYVVEVNAGFVARHSIRVGDRITWQRVQQ